MRLCDNQQLRQSFFAIFSHFVNDLKRVREVKSKRTHHGAVDINLNWDNRSVHGSVSTYFIVNIWSIYSDYPPSVIVGFY